MYVNIYVKDASSYRTLGYRLKIVKFRQDKKIQILRFVQKSIYHPDLLLTNFNNIFINVSRVPIYPSRSAIVNLFPPLYYSNLSYYSTKRNLTQAVEWVTNRT